MTCDLQHALDKGLDTLEIGISTNSLEQQIQIHGLLRSRQESSVKKRFIECAIESISCKLSGERNGENEREGLDGSVDESCVGNLVKNLQMSFHTMIRYID